MKMLTILLLSVLMLSGCSGDLLESRIQDINSGTYKVSGIQVELTYDFPWPSWGGKEVILSRDTTEIEFTVEVKYQKGRPDSVRFIRLAGAERAVVSCRDLRSECVPYAKLDGTKLTFDIVGLGGYYNGNGFLGAEKLILETRYEYRGTGIDYYLEGKKID